MYGLPASYDPGFFIGLEVISVCFTQTSIALTFEPSSPGIHVGDLTLNLNKTIVTSEATIILEIPGSDREFIVPPAATGGLMKLLSDVVKTATSQTNGTLALIFASGASVQFVDDRAPYFESYTIQSPVGAIIV